MKNSTGDLILGEVVYISIIYRIPDSKLYSLNGYDFSFDHMAGENRELKTKITEKIYLEEGVNSQELEDTAKKRRRITHTFTGKFFEQAAALFRRDKFILLQVCLTRPHFSVNIFTRKEPGT